MLCGFEGATGGGKVAFRVESLNADLCEVGFFWTNF